MFKHGANKKKSEIKIVIDVDVVYLSAPVYNNIGISGEVPTDYYFFL